MIDSYAQAQAEMHGTANDETNTPENCHTCRVFFECIQAQHMTSNTETVQGYAADADYYCLKCTPSVAAPLSAHEELDSPAHCAHCGIPLAHALTEEGAAYVARRLDEGGGCCHELWPVVWKDYLD